MEEIVRIAATVGSACACYVNAAEIQQGNWKEDPKQCLRNCKIQFLWSVLKEWEEDSDLGWLEGCRSLDRGVPVQEFWSLYWCDSTFCGVGIDPAGGLGQDPNVDIIINTCQNIGFHSVLDPGPPPRDFKCSTEADAPAVCSATIIQASQTTQGSQPSAPSPSPPQTTTTIQTRPNPAAVPSGPASSSRVATGSSTPTAKPSTTSGRNMTGQGKAAVAVCAVLALILIVSFAIVWFRRRKRRKESFHRALRSRRGISSHDVAPAGSPTPLISPANSAIGTRAVLTPPLRLRDRKFLPSILRHGSRSPSPPLTPLTPAHPQLGPGGSGGVFPSSPICSPTTSKLVPRQERTLTPRSHARYTGHPAPAPLFSSPLTPESTFSLPIPVPGSRSSTWPLAPPSPGGARHSYRRGSASASSVYTGTGTGTSTAHSSLRHEIPIAIPLSMGTAGSSSSTPPPRPASPSLSRPRRQHLEKLDVPGLLTPVPSVSSNSNAIPSKGRVAGVSTPPPPPPPPLSPPPTKALPQPPPSPSLLSPSSPARGGSPALKIPVAVALGSPPPLALGRPASSAAVGGAENTNANPMSGGGGGKSNYFRPGFGRESYVAGNGTTAEEGLADGSLHGRHHHQQDYARPPPAYSFVSSGKAAGSETPKERVLSRGSWGSWSGTAGRRVVEGLTQPDIRQAGNGGEDCMGEKKL